jgi:hypothetical protein
MHDGVQFSGIDLPIRLRGAGNADDDHHYDHGHDHRQRYDERDMPFELQHIAALLSDELRAAIALAVAAFRLGAQPNSPSVTMVSTIGSIAFSAATLPASIASVAR